jgi:murein DD-endopeptidase MepM/ murein hydrolase activator NlpD
MAKKYCATATLIILGALFLMGNNKSFAETSNNLKQQINDKAQALQEINQKILETQQELGKTANQSKTLNQEIQRFDYTINQLNLNIRASEIMIDKLNLEIESLQYEIGDIQNQIQIKKSAVASLLDILNKRDQETALTIFLRNKSLAESFTELQNLADFNFRLSNEVSGLLELNSQLSGNLELNSQKKQNVISENNNLKNKKTITNNQKSEKQTQTKNQEKAYQQLISELEQRQSAIAAEIEKLEEELRLTIDPSLLPAPRSGVLEKPIKGPLTQGYGDTGFAKTAYRGKWHNGVDFGAPIGTPIVAAESGTIVEMWDQDKYCYKGAYGKFMVIQHNNNLTTLYAHLSLFNANLKKGDSVNRGELIGYVGNSGYATGPHLHLTVYASQTFRIGSSKVNCGPVMPYGGDLDPMKYL